MLFKNKQHLKQVEFTYRHSGLSISCTLWHTPIDSDTLTIILLGTVQVGKMPVWVAEHCPENTIVVQGAPHWLARDDGKDIPEFMHGFTESAITFVLSHYHPHSLQVIADSQAAPGAIRLFTQEAFSGYLRGLVLLQPLGFNKSAFATGGIDAFMRRITHNARYQVTQLVSDPRLLYNHRQLLSKVRPRSAKAQAQYTSGILHDAAEDLKTLRKLNSHIVIICGEKDQLFPATEITQTLSQHSIDVEIQTLPGVPHSPIATRFGLRLLDRALEYLHSKK